MLNVYVISPDTRSERRFDPHITIQKLKDRIELITGVPTANQALSLYNSEGDTQALARLDDDTKPLGFYGIKDLQVIKVEDTDPSVSFTGQLTDVSQVDKFELSEAEYAARQDTVLAYKQRNKMGRFNDKAEASQEPEQAMPSVNITVGSRCEVESLEQGLSKRGTVRFVGHTKFSKGVWIGIEYDEPIGKNDGSVQGEQYFSCRPKYGVFVRPDKVTVGNFPVEDISLDEEM